MTKVERFDEFVVARFKLGDWSNFLSADRARLSRKKILKACLFTRSSLYQNIAFQNRLAEVEAELRGIGVLKQSGTEPSILLDETSLLITIDEMEQRLEVLCGRMNALSLSIEGARNQVQQFNIE